MCKQVEKRTRKAKYYGMSWDCTQVIDMSYQGGYNANHFSSSNTIMKFLVLVVGKQIKIYPIVKT